MRDIIFRGKRLDNEAWVYGDLIENQGRYFIYHAMSETTIEDNDDGRIVVAAVEVDPDTVGQYTGLQDKNGKKIFKGDILSDGAFTYEVRYKGTGFVTILDGHVYTMDTRPTKIVIGNIHDNPDLLK